MVITHKSPNMIEFNNLSCGVVFKDKHSNICMKIEESVSGHNMVYLCDGSIGFIDEDEKVEKIRCELIIEG